MNIANRLTSCLASLALVAAAISAPHVVADETADRIAAQLSKSVPGLQVTEVLESEAPGLYEVRSSNGETIYSTSDGQHLLTGDLLRVTDNGLANVSEENRTRERKAALEAFGKKGVISYPADGKQKAEIAVFTDIDCPYCRKFHDNVPRLNELGITVHYYGFPRSGPNTASFRKYESVWCSDDQNAAMDAAKQGRQVEQVTCENPVAKQFQLGGKIDVTGTPAIVLEDGNMVRGFVPADRLAEGLGLL